MINWGAINFPGKTKFNKKLINKEIKIEIKKYLNGINNPINRNGRGVKIEYIWYETLEKRISHIKIKKLEYVITDNEDFLSKFVPIN